MFIYSDPQKEICITSMEVKRPVTEEDKKEFIEFLTDHMHDLDVTRPLKFTERSVFIMATMLSESISDQFCNKIRMT